MLPENKPTIVFISTYPPRECGIATFTHDLFHFCRKIPGSKFNCKIAALNLSSLDTYKYPSEVVWEVDQNSKQDYLNLAHAINNDHSISGVILQHEYGIFGGVVGENILFFMRNCKKPTLTTLHTALPTPDPTMKKVTAEIIKLSDTIVVLTTSSKEIIEHVYPESINKIFVIPHGIHEVALSSQKAFKEKLELTDHIIVSTFGLMSRGKGIEYVIQALPKVIKKFPTLLYLILGETHPIIRRNEGEKYRLELAEIIKTLGLEKNVKFYDQYLSLPDLLEFLQATDIYISSSINPHQAVSGTLSYALGTGRAVISTEFAQAKEVITPAIGRLVPIKNSPAISEALLDLLSDEEKLKKMAKNAYDKTRVMLWSNVAKEYVSLLTRTMVPPIQLHHLAEMTDDFGLFQFAHFTVPNKESGYTLDDNARALVTCSLIIERKYSKKAYKLLTVYLSFIRKCLQYDNSFINYIGFDKSPTDQNNHEDLEESQARAMWALAVVMNNATLTKKVKNEAKLIFLSGLGNGLKLQHLRGKAFYIKAFVLALKVLPDHQKILSDYINEYVDSLVAAAKTNSHKEWVWFEKDLNYNNAVLSESLLIAGIQMKNRAHLELGIRTLYFLTSKTFTTNMYMPIGHSHWYTNKEKRSQYDQQPEDPASMISALSYAYKITHDEVYRDLAKKCFSWFLGNNTLGKPLYDEKTGGCFDGLHPDRVNLNQGAESLVSYLISNLIVSSL